ncbi:TadE/TadG family type IV pilus assembly protein [Sphingomonas oligophenolica]|uniref:Pilus assembly protein TadG n=1 Tax=Sphingomonas oligophenolica TaxID=301154 RepID=A0A502BY61_9SPHN|nr:TadE/TadG family type IV pilus assembly protein [Sphingomonas oligophenolica]TPG04436.1 pilus assembly protein TadG [Sphingomonas oligophenolica]
MGSSSRANLGSWRSFLGTLRRDVRANTLAIMAAMLFPLAGLVGGGIDVARIYITKTRLQHACDAGVLAGRKAMGGGTWGQNNSYPNTSAVQFFDANYKNGSYGAGNPVVAFSENAGKVTGNASVQLPMTLMKIFAVAPKTLAVSCATEMRLPNTDIMFVLDTTGSMGDTPSGDSQSKMASLKVAVKCFYEVVARLKTDANCTTGSPGGGTGSAVQVRFGFVPYATNVNVGYLLNPGWFASQWGYQSRAPRWWISQGNPQITTQNVVFTKVSQSNCTDAGLAAAGYNSTTATYGNNNTTKDETTTINRATSWDNPKGGTCYATETKTVSKYSMQENVAGGPSDQFIDYHYGKITQSIAGLKNGGSWNSSFTLPLGTNGATKTIKWDGCIEERQTVGAASYIPIPSGAKDLDIDATPTTGDASSLWGPALPGMIFTRNGGAGWTQTESYTTNDYPNQSGYYCPVPATKLQAWPDASAFDSYVDTLTPNGNTYHDIGLLWGARLMSPTGLFSTENAFTPQGGEIQRNLIFMTDGDPCTGVGNYQAYGVAWFDRRQTDPATAPTDGCTTTGTLTQQVNARTDAICSAIKNKNITLWVITFGYVAPSTVTRMTNCASPDRYFSASNAATLQQTFASIANQISQLRIVQ